MEYIVNQITFPLFMAAYISIPLKIEVVYISICQRLSFYYVLKIVQNYCYHLNQDVNVQKEKT